MPATSRFLFLLLSTVLAVALSVPVVAAAPGPQQLEIDSVEVSAFKVVGGDTLSGTVTLNQVATSDVDVFIGNSSHAEIAAVSPNPVTVAAGATSAGFTVTTATTTITRKVVLQGLLADGSSTVTPEATFYIVPTATTDLITITKANMSRNGTLTITAQSDNPNAVLSATFNDQPVPGQSRNGTLRAKVSLGQPASGIVEVTSDLGGCAQRSAFGNTSTTC